MKLLEAVFGAVSTFLLHLATGFLLLMTALVVTASFMRYIVGRPFAFTEELVALLYMAMVFLAVPIVTMRHRHVAISVLPSRVMTLLRHPFRLAACVAMIAFCTWFAIAAYGFVEQSYNFNSHTEQVEFLLWPWMAIIPAMMGFMAVISLLHLVQSATGEDTGAEDETPAGDAL